MAEFRLQAGASINVLTKGELDDSLKADAAAEWSERARGIKVIRVTGTTASIGTAAAYAIQGPRQGYSWALRLLGVAPSTAASVTAWITGDNAATVPVTAPVGVTASGTSGTAAWSSVQAVMNGGEYLVLAASATVTTPYVLYAVETPTELLWKLV